MRFVYLDSRFTLHASSPRSVALTQLRFACLAVASLAGDLHPEECAHAGRTRKTDYSVSCSPFAYLVGVAGFELATPCTP